ncbi:hypothetical protein ABBQ32_002507 [Trebouxia sp. C0010 RCD-2024]
MSGRQVCKHNSLATKAPKVAAQWDYDVNADTPDSVVVQSNIKVGWKCSECDCKWSTSPNARLSKSRSGCPECAKNRKTRKKQTRHPTFAECQHPLLPEWDHKRNATQGHFPDNTRLRSGKKVFWLCTHCPAGQEHSWPAMPGQRTTGSMSGCPFCAGQAACTCNSLQALYPDIAAKWDHSKNAGLPSDFTGSSSHLAWWSSPQRARWQQSIHSQARCKKGLHSLGAFSKGRSMQVSKVQARPSPASAHLLSAGAETGGKALQDARAARQLHDILTEGSSIDEQLLFMQDKCSQAAELLGLHKKARQVQPGEKTARRENIPGNKRVMSVELMARKRH